MAAGRPTHAVVDLAALRANYAEAESRAGGAAAIAVVKADAYGHGAAPVARALVEAGCRRLAVVTADEAVRLRDAGVKVPILVLGGVHDVEEADAALTHALVPVLHDERGRELLSRAAAARGGACAVHVEVDTGMRRMGAPPDEAPALLAAAAADPHLAFEGVFTHFARADEADLGPSLEQLARFREVLDAAGAQGALPEQIHAANSAALLAGKELAEALPQANAVRPGLMLYGVRPAPHLDAPLRPVMTLLSRVVQLRTVRRGETVGYSAGFRARRKTRVATLPLGYADGVPVASGGRARVVLRGERLPIVGRVSMDYVTVDVGDAPVEVGDEALLFGERGGARLSVEEAAHAAGTISYELLVRVGARVPRVTVG